MKVIITETTQVASALARALRIDNKSDINTIFADDNTAVIAIARDFITPYGVGVLPGKNALPVIPERYTYGLRLTPDQDGRLNVSSEDQAYADRIREILAKAREVTFASDGGADAQGRFANICRFFKVGVTTSRMWVTQLDKKVLKRAYNNRKHGRSLFNLGQSGLVGMAMDEAFKYNITEAYRALFPKMRVPLLRQDVLALAIAKSYLDFEEEAHANHKPVTTHSLCITGGVDGQMVQFYPVSVFAKKEDCVTAYNALCVKGEVKASDIQLDKESNDPPALFILSTLQAEAWKKLAIPFTKTAGIAEALFLKGLISSPHTFNAKLLESTRPDIFKRNRLYKWCTYSPTAEVPTTHGIITTCLKPMCLGKDEQAVYDLVAERSDKFFRGSTSTTSLVIGIEVEGEPYYGTMPWKYGQVAPAEINVALMGKSYFTHTTKPRKAPQMDDLLSAVFTTVYMLSARHNEGTPFSETTHDVGASIDRLIANGFLYNVCGEPAITADGHLLLDTFDMHFALDTLMGYQIRCEQLYANRKQSKGGKALMQEYGERLYRKTEQLITDSRIFPATEDNICPMCGRHSAVRYPRVLKCHVCGYSMPLQYMGHKFTDKDIAQLQTHRYTSILEFRNKRGHEFHDIAVVGNGKGLEFAPIQAKIY